MHSAAVEPENEISLFSTVSEVQKIRLILRRSEPFTMIVSTKIVFEDIKYNFHLKFLSLYFLETSIVKGRPELLNLLFTEAPSGVRRGSHTGKIPMSPYFDGYDSGLNIITTSQLLPSLS